MSSTKDELSEVSRPRQTKAWKQLLAVVLGVLPLYSGMIFIQILNEHELSVRAFTVYLAVIAPLAIAVALLLLRLLCAENPRALNLRPGKLSWDLLATLVLSLVIIVVNVVSTRLLTELLPEARSNASVRNLFSELAGKPGLLVLFAGPLFFLGAASEEVIRVFLLSRLMKVWHSATGKLLAVVISACLFGLIHLYRGPVRVVCAAIFGLIMALYYLRFGRVLPLILAHYLTNAFQVLVFVVLGP
jgi:membrane protease YdiL (CAAX protease family)